MFAAALKQLEVVNQIDPNYVATDDDLKLKRPAELRHELEEGMRVTVDDFNPFKLARERK
jgi:glycerol-3-phosphate cytidylyltransferase-like family protein